MEYMALEDFDAFVVLLDDIEEYFNERADADQPAGCDCPIPNEEMSLLTRLQRAKKGTLPKLRVLETGD